MIEYDAHLRPCIWLHLADHEDSDVVLPVFDEHVVGGREVPPIYRQDAETSLLLHLARSAVFERFSELEMSAR